MRTATNTTQISYEDWENWLIETLFREGGIANIPYLARLLAKATNRSYESLRVTIHKIAKRLEKKGIIEIHKAPGNPTWIELKRIDKPPKTVDLISKLRVPETTHKFPNFVPSGRVSSERVEAAKVLYLFGIEEKYRDYWEGYLRGLFYAYLDRIKDRVLLFRDPDTGEFLAKKYSTRFTDPSRSRYALRVFNYVWNYYARKYRKGVFLTITLPPVIPLGLAPKVISYMVKQLMAWIRKNNKGKEIRTIRVNEFQENGYLHVHLVIFGIGRIADKKELTTRLDLWFVNALLRLEKEYGDLAYRLLDNYIEYCESHKKYEGPINWVTKIDFKTGKWNPPPDYLRYLESFEKRGGKGGEYYNDGGSPDPSDYLSKYVRKFIWITSKIANGDYEDGDLSMKFLMYWVTGIRFFTVYNKVYKELGLTTPRHLSNWEFYGSYRIQDLPDSIFYEIIDQIEWFPGVTGSFQGGVKVWV